MDERLAAADAALKAGRGDEAILRLTELLEAEPAQPAQVYRALLMQLYRAGRQEEGVRWGEAAAGRFARDADILNMLGVSYRRRARFPEALATFDQAAKLSPGNPAIQSNRGNVLLDMDDGVRAEAVFAKLARAEPRNSDYQRQLGRALLQQGKTAAAMTRLRQAVALKKDQIEAWLDMIGYENEMHHLAEAEALADKALAANPDHPRLLDAKATVIRRTGAKRRCEAFLLDLLPRFQDAAWLHAQLGAIVTDYDPERAATHLRRAAALEPDNIDRLMAVIECLERLRKGDEGANIEEAYQLAGRALALKPTEPGPLKILNELLIRVCAFDELEKLGDFKSLGRAWANSNRHTALLKQLGQVRTLDDRYELLEQHRIWARQVETTAARHPVRRPPPRARDGKIRLGFMSSDLRRHPVGYFALPLFEHVDPERFEIFCYSFYQGEHADMMQEYFASKSAAYRWQPDINTPAAAQLIADDQLDILIELGGSTHMNKLDVMAYRPAPKQASWLGYPHSAGLSTIDYLICDPHNAPPRRDLLIEEPLLMPKSWIALGRMVFSDSLTITPGLPGDRNGRITFGTANNPHKYNRAMLDVWSQVMRETPESQFMFIRPEGGSASFRRNLIAEFVRNGIAPERIVFSTVRGAHMPFYNEVDVSLDTFPLTGGTTTTEALWMGVPVVSLIGEAFYERLGASILANSGLADLATEDKAEFVRLAVNLAADRDRRLALRENLREQIKSGPLGQTKQFARDFYDMIARAVAEAPA
ncbi:tetratricopeptide repeat protein [Phenylobacterium sp.]|jgi:predicted O-linked N-acetylglucosamine transferase (SPINDLY family)|uniref:tetratricopeptide repeat protein n=1 Tax=Phenylobacterium sp. TaxID=1871053 RepID=UPI002E313156|nr:tetratricopeptide repeat protein [Phenylobacterium sp.]HEX4709754.1 tetratricopeptide repeat protein [Phenylobacterium sp.]